jgi:general stress protein 26
MGQATEPLNVGISVLKDLLSGERTCMMTEASAHGELASKPMTLLKLEDDGVLWFMTSVNDIDQSDWSVNVAFSNEGDNNFVSIQGLAQADQDRDKIHELWSMACKPWFPEGPDSPDIALIKVIPTRIEYWDGPSNVITKSASMLASVVAGKPIGMGVHGFIQP